MIKVFMACEGIAYRKEVTCKDTKDDNYSFFSYQFLNYLIGTVIRSISFPST